MLSLRTTLFATAALGAVILLTTLGLHMITTATFILLGVVLVLPVGVALFMTNLGEPAKSVATMLRED